MIKIFKLTLVFTLLLTNFGYSFDNDIKGHPEMTKINDIPAEAWEKLSQTSIYFGHQSVGYNIIDGMKLLISKHSQIKLNITETDNPQKLEKGFFYHSRIGVNEDPASKTDDFVRIIESGIGNNVNVAFHKYCYIDINSHSNVNKIFEDYKDKMNILKSNYPNTKFIHVTVPLTTIQKGPKMWIKKILRKPIGGVRANVRRNEYNLLLSKAYKNKEPFFDLASFEAKKPDGSHETFKNNDKMYLSMFPDFSSKDGGHLNKHGEMIIAEQLLIFLAQQALK